MYMYNSEKVQSTTYHILINISTDNATTSDLHFYWLL